MATDVKVGVILEINGEDVSLEPTTSLANVKQTGVEYSLPRRVEVGTAKELVTFLSTLADQEITLPSSTNFPEPLASVYKRLNDLNLTVEQLDIKVPPSEDTKNNPISPEPRTTITLGLSATWSAEGPINLIDGKLAIKGLYVTLVRS